MIETKNWAVTHAIRDAVRQTYSPYLGSDEVKKLASRFNVDLLGDGASCFVLALKTDTDWVAAPTYRDISRSEALVIYHLHRILNLLFPHNFPRLRFSSGKHPQKDYPKNISGTLRKTITGVTTDDYGGYRSLDQKSQYPFAHVLTSLYQLNLPLIEPDLYGPNYILYQNGGVYYVDTLWPMPEGVWDLRKIKNFMTQHRLSHQEMEFVCHSIYRLGSLCPYLQIEE